MNAKHTYIIALALFLGFCFNFAHSELGFMTCESDAAHYAHEFCQLTNAPATNLHVSADSFIQRSLHPFLSIVCILPEAAPVSGCAALRYVTSASPGRSSASDTPLSVINRTLLI